MEAAKKAADFYGLNFDEEIEEMERTKVNKKIATESNVMKLFWEGNSEIPLNWNLHKTDGQSNKIITLYLRPSKTD